MTRTRLAPALLAGLLALPACGGRAALEEPLTPIPVRVDRDLVEPPLPRLEWTVGAAVASGASPDEDPPSPTRDPALGAGLVYLAYGDVVRALRLDDGAPAWEAHLPGPALLPPVPVAGGVALATEAAWVWIDDQGRGRGSVPMEGAPAAAVDLGDTLAYADGGSVRALRHPSAESAPGPAWRTTLPGATGLSVGPERGVIVVTAGEQGVAALDRATGAVRWRRENLAVIPARAAVGRRRAFVVGSDSRVRAIDLGDGDVEWTSRPVGVRVQAAPVTVDDVVWVAGLDAALHGYTVDGGSQLFRLPLSGRAYLDLATWQRWVVVSPRYGPWNLVRGPLASAGPSNPGSPRKVDITAGGDVELAPGVGSLGIVLVDTTGTVRLLRTPPWTRPETEDAGVRGEPDRRGAAPLH